MKRPSRDPGNAIKQLLRREVNYGCPIRYKDGSGCGCPILTFHHFDPPWSGHFEHNPDGMIALCPEHHHQADGGLWSNAQLKRFKNAPYVDDVLKVQWPWQPETLIMKVGASLVVGSGSPFRFDGIPVFRFFPKTIDDLNIKSICFDADIRDSNKKRWLRIQNGWFDLRLENTTDVLFTPQTRTLLAKHNDDTFISLQFKKYRFDELNNWLRSFISDPTTVDSALTSVEKVNAIDSDGNVSIVSFEGRFRTHKLSVNVKGDHLNVESFILGLNKSSEIGTWIVDDAHRIIIKMENGPEIFSIG